MKRRRSPQGRKSGFVLAIGVNATRQQHLDAKSVPGTHRGRTGEELE